MLIIDVMDDCSAGNWSVSEMNQEVSHLQKAINNTAGKAVQGHIRPALSFHDEKPMDEKKDFASIALFGDELTVDPPYAEVGKGGAAGPRRPCCDPKGSPTIAEIIDPPRHASKGVTVA